jgi:DNA-directed RNA polymerase subunit RPC12/RpoP
MNALLVFGALALVASVAAAYWYRQANTRPKEEPLLYFRCVGCNQKLRFKASKAGRPGMCPRCRHRWRLPTPVEIAQASSG